MRSTFTIIAVLVAVSFVSGQDAYTIKFKPRADVGKTISFRSSSVDRGSMKLYDAEGKLLADQKKEGGESAYRVTVLERDKDGKAIKYVRVYTKANEKENGMTKTFSYEGRTVLFEKTGDKFRVGVVGEPPLEAADSDKLQKDASKKSNSDAIMRHLSPSKAVKVGDSWSMPVKDVVEAMDDMKADLEKSSVTAKLVKVYSKGKAQFGTFDVAMKFAVIGSLEEDVGKMTFDPPAAMTVNLTIDAAIDGSSTERTEKGKMALKGEAIMTDAGRKLRLVFDVQSDGGDEHSAEIDDAKARSAPKVTFAAAPGEWAEFKNKEFGFAAKFPGTPQKKVDAAKTGITTTEYGVEADGRKIWYALIVSEYPADKFKLDPTTAYGNLRKTPNIKEAADMKIAGFPGLELKQEVKKEALVYVTQRVVVLGQRMYQLLVVAQEGSKPDAKQFFDSFQLDEKPPAKK